MKTKIVCISDTHNFQPDIPYGDILLHAGDLTGRGTKDEVENALDWLARLGRETVIIVPGNHDWMFERYPDEARRMCEDRNIILLMNESYRTHGLNFYGSPVQPTFFNWAFNVNRGPSIKKVWDRIPFDTDVLITHGPPFMILDEAPGDRNVGCQDLLDAVRAIKPKLHVFGHIHQDYGVTKEGDTLFVNASLCTEQYHCTNLPIMIRL